MANTTPNFEQIEQVSGPEIHAMIDRFQKQSIDVRRLDANLKLMAEGLKKAKELANEEWFKTASVEDIRRLSNPWSAFRYDGIFKNDSAIRHKMLVFAPQQVQPNRVDRFTRQVWRTEMTRHIIEMTQNTQRADGPHVLERVMNAQVVRDKSPEAALASCVFIDPRLKTREQRSAIAKLMRSNPDMNGSHLEDFTQGNVRVQVLVGGHFLTIPKELCGELTFKNIGATRNEERTDNGTIWAQLNNGCEGNLVLIDPGPEPAPEPEPEITDTDLALNIKEILPEYADYLRVNPQTHWLDYSDMFFTLPVTRQREIENKIKLKLTADMNRALTSGINAAIASAPTPQKKAFYEAAKELFVRGGNTGIATGRAKLKMAGPDGTAMLDQMNHDFERMRQSQLLSMFEAKESATHEDNVDDWAMFNKKGLGIAESAGRLFGEEWGGDRDYLANSKERMNVIRTVSPVVQEVFANPHYIASIKTIDDAINVLKTTPGMLPAHVSTAEITKFEKYWSDYKAGDGHDLLAVNVTDDDFIDKMSDQAQENWLMLAEYMKEAGQYDQAEQILRSILVGHNKAASDPDTVENMMNNSLDPSEKSEIQANIEKQVRADIIVRSLEEQGLMNEDGFEMFGYFDRSSGKYLDPSTGASISEAAARSKLIDQVRDLTIERLTQQERFKEAAKKDALDSVAWTSKETKAWELYKDIQGVDWHIADKYEEVIVEEIGLSVVILAATAAGVGVIGAGARLAGGAEALATMSGLSDFAAGTSRMARMTRRAGQVGRFGLVATGDGFVFHNIHAMATTPIVGADAWNNYASGVGNSILMYGAFGAGNAAWNKTMQGVGERYAAQPGMVGRLGRAAEWTQVQSIRQAYGLNGMKGVGTALVAKQPAMAMEAAALTAWMGGASEFEEGHDADVGVWKENFLKNYITLNLLWGMPKMETPPPPRSVGPSAGVSGRHTLEARKAFERYGSKTLRENPRAKLDHYKEIEAYFGRQKKEYITEVTELADGIPAMNPKCKMSICIPVAGHQEGANIYKTLELYKQQTASKDDFEILLMVNHPKTDLAGNPVRPDSTMAEIQRFQRENPDFPVHMIYKTFPIAEAKIGTIRKLANDVALARHHARGETVDDLILVSNDADLKGLSPTYVESMLDRFNSNKNIDAVRGGLDWDMESYSQNPMVHVGTRLFQYLAAYGRSRSGRMPSSGANFAYRSSIYTAIGGHLNMGGGEDVMIGQMITAARDSHETIVAGGSLGTRNMVSARRSEKAVAEGLSPIEQWDSGFGAMDSVRKYNVQPGEKINYKNPEMLTGLKADMENVINRTIDTYESGERLGKNAHMYKYVLGRLGVEYQVVQKNGGEWIEITNMDRLVKGLEIYQVEGPLIQRAKSGDEEAKAELRRIRDERRGGERQQQELNEQAQKEFDRQMEAFIERNKAKVKAEGLPYDLNELRASTDTQEVGDYVICKDKPLGLGSTAEIYAGFNKTTGELLAFKEPSRTEAAFISDANNYPRGIEGPADFAQERGLESNAIRLPKEVIKRTGQRSIEVYEMAATNMDSYIERHGALDMKDALSITMQMGSGLNQIHERGGLHTDISPNNMFVSADGTVKLGDLNAMSINMLGGEAFRRGFLGANWYTSAPEMKVEGAILKKSADIYSLTASLYHFVTGKKLFSEEVAGLSPNEQSARLAELHANGDIEIPQTLPESVQNVLKKGLQVDPKNRYQNMTEMLTDLRAAYEALS